MSYINSRKNEDLIHFYLPSFLFFIAMLIPDFLKQPFLLFFVFVILDIGHAYSTLLRTYFGKDKSQKPVWVPILFILSVFFYCYNGLPYFWTFIIFYTFFHHMRQNYGLFKWYSYLNNYKNKWDGLHIHLLAIIPFAIFYMREIDYVPLYHFSEYHSFNLGGYLKYFIISYTVYFLLICSSMLFKLHKQTITEAICLSFIYPSALNFACFMFFKNSNQAYIPLLVLHATTYLSLINFSEKRLKKEEYKLTKTWGKIILIISFFGTIEYLVTDYFDIFVDSISMKGNATISLIASISVLPNLMHYYLDGKIWKKDDPDFKKIISSV